MRLLFTRTGLEDAAVARSWCHRGAHVRLIRLPMLAVVVSLAALVARDISSRAPSKYHLFRISCSNEQRIPVRVATNTFFLVLFSFCIFSVAQPQYRGDRDHKAFLTPLQEHVERREDLWPALKVDHTMYPPFPTYVLACSTHLVHFCVGVVPLLSADSSRFCPRSSAALWSVDSCPDLFGGVTRFISTELSLFFGWSYADFVDGVTPLLSAYVGARTTEEQQKPKIQSQK